MRDLPSQIQLLLLHRELRRTLSCISSEQENNGYAGQLEAMIIATQRQFLPCFESGNPLLGYNPGTSFWDTKMKEVEIRYFQYIKA